MAYKADDPYLTKSDILHRLLSTCFHIWKYLSWSYRLTIFSNVFANFEQFAIDTWSSLLDKKYIYLHRICPNIYNNVALLSLSLSWTLIMFICSSANHNHMMALLQQLLYNEALSLSWRDIIVPVVCQVVQTVRPDVKNRDDDMDIRQFVHIKKVSLSVCV